MANTTDIEQKKDKFFVFAISAIGVLFVILATDAFIIHIRGFEYIVAVVFLGFYPVYYKAVTK